jgi:hypothetical protein
MVLMPSVGALLQSKFSKKWSNHLCEDLILVKIGMSWKTLDSQLLAIAQLLKSIFHDQRDPFTSTGVLQKVTVFLYPLHIFLITMLSCPFMLRNVLHLDGHILKSAQGCAKCILEGLGKTFQLIKVIVARAMGSSTHSP